MRNACPAHENGELRPRVTVHSRMKLQNELQRRGAGAEPGASCRGSLARSYEANIPANAVDAIAVSMEGSVANAPTGIDLPSIPGRYTARGAVDLRKRYQRFAPLSVRTSIVYGSVPSASGRNELRSEAGSERRSTLRPRGTGV